MSQEQEYQAILELIKYTNELNKSQSIPSKWIDHLKEINEVVVGQESKKEEEEETENLMEYLFDHGFGNKKLGVYHSLFIAILDHHPSFVLSIIKKFPSIMTSFLNHVDNTDTTYLMATFNSVQTSIIETLLDLQKDLDLNLDLNKVNKKGESIVSRCILYDRRDVLFKLLDLPQLDITNSTAYPYSTTSIIYAIEYKEYFQWDIVVKLLSHPSLAENPSYLNLLDSQGHSALYWAIKNDRPGHHKVLKTLVSIKGLEYGRDKGIQPALLAADDEINNGSAIAILLDSPHIDSELIKDQLNNVELEWDFFRDFFKHYKEISPSPETMTWFMSHPQLDFEDDLVMICYLESVHPPLDQNFCKQFSSLQVYEFPSNPFATLSEFKSLIALDKEQNSTEWSPDSFEIYESLSSALASSSPHSMDIIQWLLKYIADSDHEDWDRFWSGYWSYNRTQGFASDLKDLAAGSGLIESALHPYRNPKAGPPTLKQLVAMKVANEGIQFDSETLIMDLIELFQEPRNWIELEATYTPVFLYDWRRVLQELDRRLSAIIEGLGGQEIIKNFMKREDILSSLFTTSPRASTLQFPMVYSLLIHKYQFFSMEKVQKELGEEKISSFLSKCFRVSPCVSYIIDVFAQTPVLCNPICLKPALKDISLNDNLPDEDTLPCVDRLFALQQQQSNQPDLALEPDFVEEIQEYFYNSGPEHHRPNRKQFFHHLRTKLSEIIKE